MKVCLGAHKKSPEEKHSFSFRLKEIQQSLNSIQINNLVKTAIKQHKIVSRLEVICEKNLIFKISNLYING